VIRGRRIRRCADRLVDEDAIKGPLGKMELPGDRGGPCAARGGRYPLQHSPDYRGIPCQKRGDVVGIGGLAPRQPQQFASDTVPETRGGGSRWSISGGSVKKRTARWRRIVSGVTGGKTSRSEPPRTATSASEAATAASLITCWRIQPRTGGNGLPRLIVYF